MIQHDITVSNPVPAILGNSSLVRSRIPSLQRKLMRGLWPVHQVTRRVVCVCLRFHVNALLIGYFTLLNDMAVPRDSSKRKYHGGSWGKSRRILAIPKHVWIPPVSANLDHATSQSGTFHGCVHCSSTVSTKRVSVDVRARC